jgi:anti-sigma factor RsiW
MKSRDLELLSAYLDGQLNPSDSARLETRLKTDPELASVMDDLRTARSYLRQLPQRRAPRNFTLTRKMVGQNPPLPRAYPAFRWVTALATLMFFLTYGLNFLVPQFAATQAYGMGGGGAEVESYSAAEAPAAAATEAPATEAPAMPQLSAPALTATPDIAQDRISATPSQKNGVEATATEPTVDLFAQSQPQQPPPQPQPAPRPVAPIWQYTLLGIAVASAVIMLVMRQISTRRWK